MTIEGKTYLASDLAVELGVARSTINDWLTRYADYLESESRGKRKVYSEKSLRILSEISEMRNNGAGSYEIEQQLAARYGVRPEVASPDAPLQTLSGAGEAAGASAALPAQSQSEALPMLRSAFDEMTNRISGEFGRLADQIVSLEEERRKLVRRVWLVLGITLAGTMLLVLLLAWAAYRVYGNLERRSVETGRSVAELVAGNDRTSAERREAEKRRQQSEAEASKRLETLSVTLDHSQKEFKENLGRLTRELGEQRKQFEKQLKELERTSATRAEAEKLRLKEEFARTRQEELKALSEQYENELKKYSTDNEQLRRNDAETEKVRNSLQQKNLELEQRNLELEKLRRKIAELELARIEREKSALPAAEDAPVAAEVQP